MSLQHELSRPILKKPRFLGVFKFKNLKSANFKFVRFLFTFQVKIFTFSNQNRVNLFEFIGVAIIS